MSTDRAPQISHRELVEGLVGEIQKRRAQRFERDDGLYQRKNPIASDIDPDSCLRRQVLSIVKWDEAKPFDAHLKARLEVGRLLEREAGRELAELGFDVIHQQVRFELASRRTGKPCLSGKIDGKIVSAIEIPWEAKSLHPSQYGGVNTVDELLAHPFYRKHPFQLQSYLLGHGLEVGFLWLTDCLGHWKAIIVEIDYDVAERVWAFAETIVDAVDEYYQTKALPDFTDKQEECFRCPFFGRSCQPEIRHEGIVMYENGMLERKLAERAEVEVAGRKFDALDNKVKRWIKDFELDERLAGKSLVVVGDFILEFKDRHRRGYTVEATDYREVSIRRIDRRETKVVAITAGDGAGQ